MFIVTENKVNFTRCKISLGLISMCLKNAFPNTNVYFTEMANQWRIAVMTCLVLFMVMEDPKSAFSADVSQKIRMLEDKIEALESPCLAKCKR